MEAIIANALTSYTKNKPLKYDVSWELFVVIGVVLFVILLTLTPYFKKL